MSLGHMHAGPTMHDQGYGSGLPQGAIQKIQELKRLVNKYSQYCPRSLLQWIFICCINGDNKFLDDKLEQLRSLDSLAKHYADRFARGSYAL
jgi:hypothetical protein